MRRLLSSRISKLALGGIAAVALAVTVAGPAPRQADAADPFPLFKSDVQVTYKSAHKTKVFTGPAIVEYRFEARNIGTVQSDKITVTGQTGIGFGHPAIWMVEQSVLQAPGGAGSTVIDLGKLDSGQARSFKVICMEYVDHDCLGAFVTAHVNWDSNPSNNSVKSPNYQ
jgi:hypothetical protein